MKKIVSFSLALIMALSLCACGSGGSKSEEAEAVAAALDGHTWGAVANETALGTVYNFMIFTTDEDVGGGGDVEFISTLDDAAVNHYKGTFSVLINDPTKIEVSYIADVDSDGNMVKRDSPFSETLQCVYEDGEVTEISRLNDDGEVVVTLTIIDD